MEEPLEIGWVGPQAGLVVGPQGTQGRANNESQVDADLDMVPF